MRKILPIAGLVSIFLVSIASAAPQEPGKTVKLGRVEVKPSFGYAAEYSDNVFFEADNEQEDVYHIFSPGVRADYAGERPGNYANIGYNGDFAVYTDLEDNDWQRHRGFGAFGYESPVGLYLKVDDNAVFSEDPFGTFNEYNQSSQAGLGDKTRRWDNNFRSIAGYKFGRRYAVEALYRNYRIRYDMDEDEWQDRTEEEAGISGIYRLTPKTSVFAAWTRLWADYDRQNDGVLDPGLGAFWTDRTSQDHTLDKYWVGARVDPGGKLDGEARIGYGRMRFDNERDAVGRPYDDWGGLILSALVNYQPRPRTLLTLNVQQSPLGAPDAEASLFINTLVGLTWRQELAHRLAFRVLGEWNYDDYQNEAEGAPKKYFHRYRVGVGLDWYIRPWLSTGVEYRYEEKIASDDDAYGNSEYRANTAAFAVRVNY